MYVFLGSLGLAEEGRCGSFGWEEDEEEDEGKEEEEEEEEEKLFNDVCAPRWYMRISGSVSEASNETDDWKRVRVSLTGRKDLMTLHSSSPSLKSPARSA